MTRAPSDPFSIEIAFHHPTCDPAKISERLSIEPALSWKDGARFGDIVKTSTWWHGELMSGAGEAQYKEALEKIASFLSEHDSFLAEFTKGGGEIEVRLNHPVETSPKGVAIDLYLSAAFLEHLSRRKIGLRLLGWSGRPSWSRDAV